MTVEELLDSLSTNYLAQDLYVEAWRLIHSAITAARAEGAEQERERLCNVGYLLTKGEPAVEVSSLWEIMNGENSVVVARCDCYVVPASVLSPAPTDLLAAAALLLEVSK